MTLGKVPAVLERFFHKLRGGSQPILAEASDGLLYVVKFVNNLQGPNLLFNESIGTELYRLSELPVPAWRPLMVTGLFIDTNPACWIETPEGTLRPEPGLCFGSQFMGGQDVILYELLPGNFHRRVRNPNDFWLGWLLDVCASHGDNRQAIFRERFDRTLDAVFIDHGHMFGGPKGEMHPRWGASRYLDRRLYPGVSSTFVKLTRLAVHLDVDRLWSQVRALPAEWITDLAVLRLSECLNVLACSRMVENIFDSLMDLHERAEESRNDEFPLGREPATSVLRTGVQIRGVGHRVVA